MSLRITLIILNIAILLVCLVWLYKKPEWEPVAAVIGAVVALIAQLYSGGGSDDNSGNNSKMSQKGGKNSNNYQSQGNITIRK